MSLFPAKGLIDSTRPVAVYRNVPFLPDLQTELLDHIRVAWAPLIVVPALDKFILRREAAPAEIIIGILMPGNKTGKWDVKYQILEDSANR